MAARWTVRGQGYTQKYGSTCQRDTLTRFWKEQEGKVVGGNCPSLLRTQGKEEAQIAVLLVEGMRLQTVCIAQVV
jgi:hypothetical protein